KFVAKRRTASDDSIVESVVTPIQLAASKGGDGVGVIAGRRPHLSCLSVKPRRAVRTDIRGVLRAREIAVVEKLRINRKRALGVGGRRARQREHCGSK